MKWICSWLGVLWLAVQMHATGVTSEQIPMDITSSYKIEVSTLYAVCPPVGYIPLKLKIYNPSSSDQTWKMDFTYWNSGNTSFSSSYHVAAHSEEMFLVYIPRQDEYNVNYTTVNILTHGPGVASNNSTSLQLPGLNSRSSGKQVVNELRVMGESFDKDRRALADSLGEKDLDVVATIFKKEDWLEQWQAYTGMGAAYLSAEEWRELSTNQRRALLLATVEGMRLVLSTTEEEFIQLPDIPANYKVGEKYGWGRMQVLPRDPEDNFKQRLLDNYTTKSSKGQIHTLLRNSQMICNGMTPIQLNSTLLLFVVVIFGIFVGPLNLFFFGGGKNRHRILWLTPLISLTASGLVVGSIFLGDGIGADGKRSVLAWLEPGLRSMLVEQDQVYRSGLLLQTTFHIPPETFIFPTVQTNDRNYAYKIQTDLASGDWFKSRTISSHALTTVRPSRAEIRILPGKDGQPPQVRSSLEVAIKRFIWVDPDGKYWRVEDVQPGKPVVLKEWPDQDQDREKWHVYNSSDYVIRPGEFMAMLDARDEDFLATLPSIRWKEQMFVLVGRAIVEKEAQP